MKNVILIIVTVAIIVTLIVTVIFINDTQSSNFYKPFIEENTLQNTSTESTESASHSWKNYNDQQTGVSFSHPPTSTVTKLPDGSITLNINQAKLEFWITSKQGVSMETVIELEEQNSKETAEIIESPTQAQISGLSGYTYTIQGQGNYRYYLLEAPNDRLFKITEFMPNTTDSTLRTTIDKVLESSTIK